MTEQTLFANAKLILEDEVICGAVRVQEGIITDTSSGTSGP